MVSINGFYETQAEFGAALKEAIAKAERRFVAMPTPDHITVYGTADGPGERVKLLPPNQQADATWAALELAKQEAIARSAVDLAAANAKARRHNATCPRCFGPAYHGFGYKPECERVGGCLADKEPVECDLDGVRWDALREAFKAADVVRVVDVHDEVGWYTAASERAVYATRDLAVAAWREAVLARAKREAGR